MVSVCLPCDALSQHLPSYLGFSYLGRRVSLHGCSSKAQPLLLTLNKGYLLTANPPDLECGIASSSRPSCARAAATPWMCGSSSWTPPRPWARGSTSPMPSSNTYRLTWVSLTLDMGCLFTAAPAKRSHCSLPWTWGSSCWPPPLTLDVG